MFTSKRLSVVMLALALSSVAEAQVITPTGTQGSLPAATFGGSGIPNTSVMIGGTNGVVLGLSASARFANPTVTDNGAGTFFATAGIDQNAPSPANPYAMWNFNWYIGGTNANQYTYGLFYDFNPATANATHLFGSLGGLGIFPAGTQNSWNLGMDFLDPNGAPQPTFDPTAQGEYEFALVQYSGVTEVGRSAIVVSTTSTVPEPSTYALMASGLAAVFFVRRKRLAV